MAEGLGFGVQSVRCRYEYHRCRGVAFAFPIPLIPAAPCEKGVQIFGFAVSRYPFSGRGGTGVPRSQETAPTWDSTVGLCLGPYGGPWVVGCFS